MSELEVSFREYFRYFFQVVDFWTSLPEKTNVLLRPLINQCEQLRLSARAQLSEQFLEKFPGVREKLLSKIHVSIEEEMLAVVKFQEEIKIHVDELKGHLNSVEKAYEKYNPAESLEFNSLIPSSEKLLELVVDTWKCFHVLWLGVKTAIDTVDYYDEESVKAISEAVLRHRKLEKQLKYAVDITHYLRSSSAAEDCR